MTQFCSTAKLQQPRKQQQQVSSSPRATQRSKTSAGAGGKRARPPPPSAGRPLLQQGLARAALYCAYTALPTPTVYRRAGEVGNAVPLPYYQTCPP